MKRILIADDEAGQRDAMRFLLEPMGFEIVAVCDGLQAVKHVERGPFTLVILDVHMPVLGGAEAVRRIKGARGEQRVVLMSGSPEMDADIASGLSHGASSVLHKPFTFAELMCVVDAAEVPPC